jgi:enoyl-CoA hydratase
MAGEIRTERIDGVGLLTVHDPERRNSLTVELAGQLSQAVAECVADETVRALVITGTDPAFCAGADLNALAAAREQQAEGGLRAIYDAFLAVAACPLPTIAAVNGAAVGAGLNLALAADVRLVGPKARFDARFLQLGIHPGGGMTWMMQRAVSHQSARAMTLFGQVFDAEEAIRTGLAHARADDVVAEALRFAKPATETPRELVIATKASMRATANLDEHADALELEIAKQLDSLRSAEFGERLAALRAKIAAPR